MQAPRFRSPPGSATLGALLAPLGLVGLLFLGPPRWTVGLLGGSLLIGNLLALWEMVRRRRARPDEAAGWGLLALSLLIALASNGLLAREAGGLLAPTAPADRLQMSLHALIALLQIGGLTAFPWRGRGAVPGSLRLSHLLGALLFSSSLAFLLWSAGVWQSAALHGLRVQSYIGVLALRLTVMAGAASYYLAVAPRRGRGPLGWILLAAAVMAPVLALMVHIAHSGDPSLQPWLGLILINPVTLALAARSAHPMEVAEDHASAEPAWADLAPFLPYAGAALILASMAFGGRAPLRAPLAGFLAVTSLLLARQILLLRSVRRSNEHLEGRVRERTRALEEAQGLALRTERLNSVALLGAGLAHDLNNSLGVVLASVDRARGDLGSGRPLANKDLERIATATQQTATLSRRLMAFARHEADRIEPLELRAELEELRGLLLMLVPRRMKLRIESGPAPLWIRFSRGRLEQVLLNLVGNAKDASPEGGTITLAVTAAPDGARLAVSDTGTGMSQEVQARIFEPLFTTKPPGKGTGLGLPSTRALLEEAGGSIEVRSAPGRGTTFTLRLPFAEGAP